MAILQVYPRRRVDTRKEERNLDAPVLRALAVCLALLSLAPASRAELPDRARFGVAMELGDVQAARRWLDEGLDPDFEADILGSGLMIAAWHGNIALMELFVSRGAHIDHVSRLGEQALSLAAWKGQRKAVEWLLEHGAAVDAPARSWSALHYASFAGHAELADMLIARGANVDARAPNLATPLMMAIREGHEPIALRLLEAGADTRLKSDRDENALGWAMRYGRYKLAERVAPPAEVAEAVRQPVPVSQPVSVAAPARVAELLARLRRAEATGQPTDALRREFMAAVAQHRDEAARLTAVPERKTGARTRSRAPEALVITARRGKPGSEKVEWVGGGAATPAMQGLAADAGASDILSRLNQARAAGQPTEALRRALFESVQRFKRDATAPTP